MKIEVKNKLGQTYYTGFMNTARGWYEGEWNGYVNSDEVIEAVKIVMANTDQSTFTKSLNDSSKGEGSWDEANDWLGQNWIPYAVAGGLQKFAFVVSPDIFSAMSSEDLQTKIPGTGFEMRTFQHRSEAEAWLSA
ncbi:hypothetical protein [Cesiribacter andamanensis]|uniref:STAS/SEC14 domain-containing protein n=1 Tax=Cesiribacter andamanensis AMV16 TaxID=1279009 RepID=M7NBY1_9BACT|nr:hypothetical protein [Cesiribacter andamanensis]EMR04742.1 hypothetical protein ADICEAN_00013 [Cesiribacter andamanensis AMV16]